MSVLNSSQHNKVKFAINLLEPYRNAIRYCSACGTCTSTCPVYKLTRSEKDTGRGHIRMVEWWIKKLECETDWARLIKHALEVKNGLACCLRCYNCTATCPSGLEIISTLEATRQSINVLLPERDILTTGFRVYGKWFRLINWILYSFSLLSQPVKVLFNKNRFVIFQFLSGLSYLRHTEIKNSKQINASNLKVVEKSKAKIAYFHDCMSGLMHPHLKSKVQIMLHHLGYDVDVIPNTICCGAPFVAKGDYHALKSHAEHNSRVLEQISKDYDYILFSNPTCAKTVQKIYPQLLSKKGSYVDKITMDWRMIIDLQSQVEAIPKKIAYHDACHLRNYTNEGDLIRRVCSNCGDYEQLSGENDCCGFGGVFNFQYSRLARELNRKRANQIPLDTEIVVNANPACSLFLAVGLTERFAGQPKAPAILHPIELWDLVHQQKDWEDRKNH